MLTTKLPPFVAPLLLSLLAGGVALTTRRTVQVPNMELKPGPEPSCAADVLALVGGLRDGDTLGGFTVQRLTCREPRAVAIELQGTGGSLSVMVTVKGALPHSPPAQSERCDLFYSHRVPTPTQDATQRVLEATALRVRVGEAKGLPAGW